MKKGPHCRICGSGKLELILDMGKAPLVNALLKKDELKRKEAVFPLRLARCASCSFMQLKDPVAGQAMFETHDYLWYTGDMPPQSQYIRSFETLVADVQKKYSKPGDFIVEIGSNDGTVLAGMGKGRRMLGVDPATNVIIRALSKGVPSLSARFDAHNARTIRQEFGPAKVVGGANCLAHIEDMHGVIEGAAELLSKDGVFWAESNYWGGMVRQRNYALIYHEHYSYYSLKTWTDLLQSHGLRVFDAVITPAQGEGLSLRVFASKNKRAKTVRLKKLETQERKDGINTKPAALRYAAACKEEARKLFEVIAKLKKQGSSIAGYGAAARGFSVLQLAGINEKHMDYFVDDSPAKQGRYTPVTHIPVISRKEAEKRLPDYFFITAPTYADVIMAKEEKFRKAGGKFIFCDGTVTA